jgi:cell wall-associated NlpC family hydrolase
MSFPRQRPDGLNETQSLVERFSAVSNVSVSPIVATQTTIESVVASPVVNPIFASSVPGMARRAVLCGAAAVVCSALVLSSAQAKPQGARQAAMRLGAPAAKTQENLPGAWAWTTGAHTYLRVRPSAKTPVVAKVPRRTKLFVWGKFDGWYRVETTDNTFGWIHFEQLNCPKANKIKELSHAKAKLASDKSGHQTLYGSPATLKKYFARYKAPGAARGLAKQGVSLAKGQPAPKPKKQSAAKVARATGLPAKSSRQNSQVRTPALAANPRSNVTVATSATQPAIASRNEYFVKTHPSAIPGARSNDRTHLNTSRFTGTPGEANEWPRQNYRDDNVINTDVVAAPQNSVAQNSSQDSLAQAVTNPTTTAQVSATQPAAPSSSLASANTSSPNTASAQPATIVAKTPRPVVAAAKRAVKTPAVKPVVAKAVAAKSPAAKAVVAPTRGIVTAQPVAEATPVPAVKPVAKVATKPVASKRVVAKTAASKPVAKTVASKSVASKRVAPKTVASKPVARAAKPKRLTRSQIRAQRRQQRLLASRKKLRSNMGSMVRTVPPMATAKVHPISPEELMRAREAFLSSRSKTQPTVPNTLLPSSTSQPNLTVGGNSNGDTRGAFELTPTPSIQPSASESSPLRSSAYSFAWDGEYKPYSPDTRSSAVFSTADWNGEGAVMWQEVAQKAKAKPAPSRGGSPRDYANHARKNGQGMATQALTYRGMPYIRGATSPRRGFDCSGLVYFLLRQRGHNPPRTAAGLASYGKPVARKDLQEGDIVLFANTYKRGVSHVGVYVGNGKFVHAANARAGVRVDVLFSGYYGRKYYGARRPK